MTPLSVRHHEVPRWLLSHFGEENHGRLWMGFKSDRRVRLISTRDAFVRKGANLRFDYIPQVDGTLARVKSDEAEQALAAFDDLSCVAAREVIESARRWRDSGLAPARLPRQVVATCKRLIVFQARRTREAQDQIGIGDDDPESIAELFRGRADELGATLPDTNELVQRQDFTRVVQDISQNNRATFASGQHPIDFWKEMVLMTQRGLRIAVLAPSLGDFIVGSHGVTSGRTISGRDSWMPIAPDVAISHSDKLGEEQFLVAPRSFLEWHNRAALRSSKRVGGSRKETLENLLSTLD